MHRLTCITPYCPTLVPQVLSRPYRKVLAQKQAAEEAAAAAETYHKQESAGLGRAAISRFFSTFSSASRWVATTGLVNDICSQESCSALPCGLSFQDPII